MTRRSSPEIRSLAAGPASHRWASWVLPPLVAALMLGLTLLYWNTEEKNTRAKRVQNFQVAADQIVYNLKDRLATYAVVLRGVKGYFEGSESIDRQEFRAYVNALQLLPSDSGLQSISLILQVSASALGEHIRDMQRKGFADYRVQPEGARSLYAPITHIEPFEGPNLKALGFDVLTLPVAKAALDRASATGQPALSGPLALMQDGRQGQVLYLPLYDARTRTPPAPGQPVRLLGWVSAPFRLADVIRSMSREFDPDIGLQILDHTAGASPGVVLFSNTGTEVASADAGGLQVTRVLEFGGRRWLLRMSPLPSFDLRHQGDSHLPMAVMGVFLSLLLGWLTWLLATGRERAVVLAHEMTAQLRATRDDLESTLNAIPDLLFELSLEGRIHHYRSSRSVHGLLVAPPEMFLGRLMSEVVPPEAAANCLAALEAAHRTGYSSGQQYRLEIDGTMRWFELSVARKESATRHESPRFIALARDITERQLAQARTHQLIYFDALTGLPNRRMLLDRMEQALLGARQAAQVGALLYIDLDNFKQINDAHGHTLGDALLVQVAQRLAALLRPGDTVARLGGDEFVVLVHNLAPDMESAGRAALVVAEQVRKALEVSYTMDTHIYSTSSSIGVTLFPKREEGAEDLLREADTAMYRAKDLGRNRIRFYEAAMQADVQERLALEQDLKKAHLQGELSAFVQNQVDASGAVVGGELLMRWNHPVRGSVPPSHFIPIAESSGLILHLGHWMIQQACETLARLQAAGRRLSLSVNVSQRQFRQDDFVERVRTVLLHTGAPPSQLILEVTESLLIENLDDTIARMTELGQLGVRFSIDDFGTGYSSLAYLKRLPLYELKIDKSFVQDAPTDPSDSAIVQSVISVARHLNLRVVAEGVETRAQADFLIQSHCDCLQGYLFGRPEPIEDWVAHLPAPV